MAAVDHEESQAGAGADILGGEKGSSIDDPWAMPAPDIRDR
jgi:hypothetical protein